MGWLMFGLFSTTQGVEDYAGEEAQYTSDYEQGGQDGAAYG